MSLIPSSESSKSTTETDHFGKLLRAMRLENGISLRELACRTKISAVHLGEFERGVRNEFSIAEWGELFDSVPGLIAAFRIWKERQPPEVLKPLPTQPDYKALLEELLAAIHRDGGHFTKLAGLFTSLQEAHKKVEATYPSRRNGP